MSERKPKRKIKDSVFTDLFRDKKYLLQLYKTLHPEDCGVTEDDFADVTLRHVLVDADYNDLGFSVRNRLIILVESQSTWSVNIIVRAMLYLAQTYHEYFKRTGQNLYGRRKVYLPRPELYIIYTGGDSDVPDTISLQEIFFGEEATAVDVHVNVLHYADEKDIIGQYTIFCKVFNEQIKLHGRTHMAATETIRICKSRNVLKEYLESREQEVVDMMALLYDDDYILDAYARDIRREAEEQAEKRAAEETATRMLKAGEPVEKISEYVPILSREELQDLATQLI